MDFDVVLPEYDRAVAEHPHLREKFSEGREPAIIPAEVELVTEVEPPAPAIEEWTSTEAELCKIVEAGGGVFIGLQERVGGKPSVVQFNDPEGKTKSTISIDPEEGEVTPKNVRRLLEERRRTVPAEEEKPGLAYVTLRK